MTFAEIKPKIQANLRDFNAVFYTPRDLQDSIQDAYDDIAAQCHCLIKKVTLNWEPLLVYYDFHGDFYVADYLATLAIYDNVSKHWLRDDVTLIDFDAMRDNWECWHGTPQWWVASNFRKTAIAPQYSALVGTFDLFYSATAPTVLDNDVPRIAADRDKLFIDYCTADLLEQAEEFTKASIFWTEYLKGIEDYRERSLNISKRDLLLLI